ncbi:hypothetical protein CFP56_037289 [Quercus suber]|uniref:Uncharacterized protein n=1 Tax=Quercus suber TaxID=58331 RepID=A0AAW0J689_QUESU
MAPVSPSLIFSLCLIFILIPQATTQPSFICHTCSPGLGNYTTNSTYAANLNHVFYPPTPQLTMGFTVPLMARTLTKSMQLDSVEEILIKMFSEVALMTLHLLSYNFVPIKRRQ